MYFVLFADVKYARRRRDNVRSPVNKVRSLPDIKFRGHKRQSHRTGQKISRLRGLMTVFHGATTPLETMTRMYKRHNRVSELHANASDVLARTRGNTRPIKSETIPVAITTVGNTTSGSYGNRCELLRVYTARCASRACACVSVHAVHRFIPPSRRHRAPGTAPEGFRNPVSLLRRR